MKLFLSSVSVPPTSRGDFSKLVGKEADRIRVALIENGADKYPEHDRQWVQVASDLLMAAAGSIKRFDLREHDGAERLERDLSEFDVVWVGGGNTFYLRYIMQRSGFDQAVQRLIGGGIVYGGGSAGAIVAGPTIDGFQMADDPQDTPEIVLEGLGLVDSVIIPHYGNRKYGTIMQGIERSLTDQGMQTIAITDSQAVVIDGNSHRIIGAI